MKTNKYIDAISTHLKDTPDFCYDKELGDYYVWNLCKFKFGFYTVKQVSLSMYDSSFTLEFNDCNWISLSLDDLKNMLALLELDKKTASLSKKFGSSTNLNVFKPDILFTPQHSSSLFLVLNDDVFKILYTSDKFTEYDQYDHYEFYREPYEEPCLIDERLLRLMIAALEASIYHDDFYPIEP